MKVTTEGSSDGVVSSAVKRSLEEAVSSSGFAPSNVCLITIHFLKISQFFQRNQITSFCTDIEQNIVQKFIEMMDLDSGFV